ncbi:MAG TPA: hypothetical protein VG722_12705, partial [Tepidisphaeraceae bacterium]|nr:hypothetical protein [Tepidisphaeraceae bacterium]
MIFETERTTRWRITTTGLGIVGCVAIALLTVFIVSIVEAPKLPVLAHDYDPDNYSWITMTPNDAPGGSELLGAFQRHLRGSLWGKRQFLRTAFVVEEAPGSIVDLQRNLDSLDLIFPNFFRWTHRGGLQESVSNEVATAIGTRPIGILPVISNADTGGDWRGKEVQRLLADSQSRSQLIRQLTERCVALGVDGINVDFERFDGASRDNYSQWIR